MKKELIRYQYILISMFEKDNEVPVANFIHGDIVVGIDEDPTEKFDTKLAISDMLKTESAIELTSNGYSLQAFKFKILPIVNHFI